MFLLKKMDTLLIHPGPSTRWCPLQQHFHGLSPRARQPKCFVQEKSVAVWLWRKPVVHGTESQWWSMRGIVQRGGHLHPQTQGPLRQQSQNPALLGLSCKQSNWNRVGWAEWLSCDGPKTEWHPCPISLCQAPSWSTMTSAWEEHHTSPKSGRSLWRLELIWHH